MARSLPKARAIKYVKEHVVDISEAEPYLKVLIYGRNGQQKTRTAATAPKAIIADINEKGTKSAKQNKGQKVFRLRRWPDITYLYWYLKEGDHPYESVIIDTLTALQGLCIVHVLKESEDRDPDKDKKTMSMREWGKVAELMKEQIYNFRNLDMHVIFLAQERVIDDPDTERTERVPDLSPGSRAPATAAVDIIGRIYQREVRVGKGRKERSAWEPRLLVGPHDEYVTKDRTGALGRILRNPTIPKMLEAAGLEGDHDGEEDEVKPKRKRWQVDDS